MRAKQITKKEILKFLKNNREKLFSEFGVVKVALFGSFAKAKENRSSDVDIIVGFKKEFKNIHNFLALKRFLEASLKMEVDLGMISAIKPYIKKEILKEAIYA